MSDDVIDDGGGSEAEQLVQLVGHPQLHRHGEEGSGREEREASGGGQLAAVGCSVMSSSQVYGDLSQSPRVVLSLTAAVLHSI